MLFVRGVFLYIFARMRRKEPKEKTPKPPKPLVDGRDKKGQFVAGGNDAILKLRDIAIKTPLELLQHCQNYIQWCEENPIKKVDIVKGGENAGQLLYIPTERPLTLKGFCVYMVRSWSWYRKLRRDTKDDVDFQTVLSWFENLCESQRIDMAIVGVYPHQLVVGLNEYRKSNAEEYDEQENGAGVKEEKGFTIKIVQ